MELSPEVYRQAAMRIYKGESRYACVAIRILEVNVITGFSEHENKFSQLFKPEDSNAIWFGDVSPENQTDRITALLLMSEVIENE